MKDLIINVVRKSIIKMQIFFKIKSNKHKSKVQGNNNKAQDSKSIKTIIKFLITHPSHHFNSQVKRSKSNHQM